LSLSTLNLRKININTASLEELKAHPYIRWQLANALLEYRNQHGPFLTVEDIKKLFLITDEIFKKISPYLITH
jgi:competence ComEA-like helix-hairpin-helix protein